MRGCRSLSVSSRKCPCSGAALLSSALSRSVDSYHLALKHHPSLPACRVVPCRVVSCRVVCCLVCMCVCVWLSQVLCYVAGREQRACRQFWRAGCLYISSARDTAFNDACTNRSGCALDVAGRGCWCARVCLLLEDASRLDIEQVLPPAEDGHACSTEQWQQ